MCTAQRARRWWGDAKGPCTQKRSLELPLSASVVQRAAEKCDRFRLNDDERKKDQLIASKVSSNGPFQVVKTHSPNGSECFFSPQWQLQKNKWDFLTGATKFGASRSGFHRGPLCCLCDLNYLSPKQNVDGPEIARRVHEAGFKKKKKKRGWEGGK